MMCNRAQPAALIMRSVETAVVAQPHWMLLQELKPALLRPSAVTVIHAWAAAWEVVAAGCRLAPGIGPAGTARAGAALLQRGSLLPSPVVCAQAGGQRAEVPAWQDKRGPLGRRGRAPASPTVSNGLWSPHGALARAAGILLSCGPLHLQRMMTHAAVQCRMEC
jgi:hypothetical protein